MKAEPREKLWFPMGDKAPYGLYLYFWVYLCSGGEENEKLLAAMQNTGRSLS